MPSWLPLTHLIGKPTFSAMLFLSRVLKPFPMPFWFPHSIKHVAGGQVIRFATFVPRRITRETILCICGQWMLQDLCSVWHGRFQLLPEVPFEADHGQRLSVTELLARTLGTKRPLERYCCRYVRNSRVPNPFPAFAEECDLHSATSPCARSASTTRMFCPRAR